MHYEIHYVFVGQRVIHDVSSPDCNARCLNGGGVTCDCKCKCPAGFSGNRCQGKYCMMTDDNCYNSNKPCSNVKDMDTSV